MNTRQTRQVALLGSIKHWIENANAVSESDISTDPGKCDCCKIWNTENGGDCEGCPIYDFTGEQYCRGTPYMDASIMAEHAHDTPSTMAQFHAAARKEVKFLMKVLMKELK